MPDTQIVTDSKNDGEVSCMGGYEGKVSGNDGNKRKRREGIKPQREETETRGLYPSLPETWNVAESKCGKEVSGMGGYERHVSGHDGNERKRREGIKPQREEKDTKGRSPSMPETWNVAVSKCGKEVSGMGGYKGMYPAMTESRRM
jgi:hypothetical protein